MENVPLVSRGNAQSMKNKLRGTADEVWVKYLKVHYKNRAMPEDAWRAIIKKAGLIKAKAY